MAKIIKLKDLIKEGTWNTRKFGEPLPTMEDYKTAYNKKHNITEAEPPKPPAGGGAGEDTGPKKLKIDIPDSPFEPDINQIKDRLKQILKQWQVKEYPSDEIRWKLYYKDILKLVKHLDGDK